MVEWANLQAGRKVLIHAGSGGVGTIAIQLAKQLGASVATTTSTANIDLVKSLGADVVIDYTKQAFETVLHAYDVDGFLDAYERGGETPPCNGSPTTPTECTESSRGGSATSPA